MILEVQFKKTHPFLIEGGIFKKTVDSSNFKNLKNISIIDGRDKTIIPGLSKLRVCGCILLAINALANIMSFICAYL